MPLDKMANKLISDVGNNYEKLLENKELWRKKYPNYAVRNEQVEICSSISKSFNENKIVCIEGPTSVGKTIGYLLSAILYAHTKKERIFISTNTKGLQNQLIDEIENLIAILELKGKFTYGVLKGKNNYICIEKVKELYDDAILRRSSYTTNEKLAILYLKRLCESDKCVTIDEINHWAKGHFFSIKKFLPMINCESRECNGENCEFEKQCLYVKHLKTLKRSNLMIINHSLMLRWPYGTMKDFNDDDITIKNIIVDEAHNLPSTCYDAFSIECDLDLIEEGIEIAKTTFVMAIMKYRGYISSNANIDSNLSKNLDNVLRIIRDIKSNVSFSYKQGAYNYNVEISDQWIEKNELLVDKFKGLMGALQTFNKNSRKVLEALRKVQGIKDKEFLKKLEEWMVETSGWENIISKALVEEKSLDYCYSIEINSKTNNCIIRIISLDIGKIFCDKIISGLDSAVFISATLTADNKNMNYFKNTMGLKLVEREKLMNDLIVKGAIDKKSRRVVIVPKYIRRTPQKIDEGSGDLDEYINEISQAIEEIIVSLNGHSLVLFPNKIRMEMVLSKIEENLNDLGIEVYKEKKGLDFLKDSSNKCVCFGSKGFYEGIDIPGDGLVSVILEKVPHKYSNSPLYRAMERRFLALSKENTENTFFKKILYPSVLTEMKQIEGRLLRTTKDFGSFIVLNGFNKEHYKSAQNFFNDMDLEENREILFESKETILQSLRSRNEQWILEIIDSALMKKSEQIKSILYEGKSDVHIEIERELKDSLSELKMSGFNLVVSVYKENTISKIRVVFTHTVYGDKRFERTYTTEIK